ncbi:DUF3105 domain-containing protein [Peterkaempfera griseoplana]|uniref:DUF3105 domain-containing protein n=1 Tax=Peterkaempfera griseoplana TaxID=66896 RepID=UPI0006E3DC43|nr:DUF3105 domain-containing protein [Peterkaempfera griseoplana]
MGSAKQSTAARRARIEQLRQEEKRRERRNKAVAFTVAGVVIAGMIGGGAFIVINANNKNDAKKAKATASASAQASAKAQAAKVDIAGVKTWKNLTYNHVNGKVDYPMTPPVGGNHNPVWLDCEGKVYDKQVPNENAVHSLEHGAVWVTYNNKATAADIKTLSDKVAATTYSFMSPYPSEQGTITLSAWGTQLVVDSAKDPRVNQFFLKYVQGPQTREPGASCADAGAMQ